MSSEAITRNDLTAILNEVLPPTPSEYRKLLWANPSPTSAFSAQTINLDLSNYDDVEIFFVGGATNSNYGGAEQKFPVNSGQLLSMFATQATGVPRPQRGLTITSTGITFTAGGWTSGTTFTSNDLYCVPVYIYGIKYERVAPPQVDASDYVVERGTSGIWTYRKWNSGEYEAWGYYQATGLNCTTSSAGTYYGGVKYIPLPSFVLTVSGCTYGNTASQSSGVYIYSTVRNGDNLEVNYRAHASSSNSSCGGFFHLFGTWK